MPERPDAPDARMNGWVLGCCLPDAGLDYNFCPRPRERKLSTRNVIKCKVQRNSPLRYGPFHVRLVAKVVADVTAFSKHEQVLKLDHHVDKNIIRFS